METTIQASLATRGVEEIARSAVAVAEDPRVREQVAKVRPLERPPGDWPAIGSVPVSALIPVKNEQRNIAECIRRLSWAEQVVVVDSNSSDLTVPMSQAFGAEVYQFKLSAEGWPKKKNWALGHVPWRHPWVLTLDADEHMTPELAREVAEIVRGGAPGRPSANTTTGYWINRKFMFLGKWIRYCGYYPSWNIRLMLHEWARYERIGQLGDTSSGDTEVHEHVVLSEGTARYLKNDFLHYAYPDIATWVEKHNRYSSWEAHAMLEGDRGEVEASLFGGPIQRRRWIKRITRHWPFRPWLRFLYAYVLQKGFLDGEAGYYLCRLLSEYELLTSVKYRELQLHRRKKPN